LFNNKILIPEYTKTSKDKWSDIVIEPANKFTFLFFRTHYTLFMKAYVANNEPSSFLLDENVALIPFYIVLPIYVPYSVVFREKIDLMLSNGMIQKFNAEQWLSKTEKKSYVEEVVPQVLTVDTLGVGFMAFLICSALSFAVFFIELIVRFCIRHFLATRDQEIIFQNVV
jgi:hypothetical protein